MTSVPDSISAEFSHAEDLLRAESYETAVETLLRVVEREADPHALFVLASTYLELGKRDEALRYASVAVDVEPSSAPARDLLAKVNLALGNYASAFSDYDALAALCREQRPTLPQQYSIPAHFAVRNLEQLDHILTVNRGKQALAGPTAEQFHGLRRGLADVIDRANGEAPWLSVNGRSSGILADLPYMKVAEEKLPSYLNADVDYQPMQREISAGQLTMQVIDNFLTPEALQQVQTFCLESTVWRRPYKFGYVGAFPQDGFASISLYSIAEEFVTALGEAFDGYHLAQWWAFEYDTRLPGTDIHGDDADFSLNFWITPDSANLDPNTGGLVVWDKAAPSDWSFDDYNSGGERVRQYLQDHHAESTVIPYRENRAVLFKGHLFHRTDDFSFAPGFANRRRSVTLLFRRTKKP
jgi:tetratricopeptide (TPR) repeat protein